MAHWLHTHHCRFVARLCSQLAKFFTGIEIHPGAKIGRRFVIDHGTGIVIGETTVIGEGCKIYQGVTLGAKSLSKGALLKDVKRHPTIGNGVTLYANASILGGDTYIGDNTIIGSSVFIVGKTIPANHKVISEEPQLSLVEKGK
jgi:serine O-acetyltransferase